MPSSKKICPLLLSGLLGRCKNPHIEESYCYKGECGFWDKFYEQCSVVSISADIANMSKIIKEIGKKKK